MAKAVSAVTGTKEEQKPEIAKKEKEGGKEKKREREREVADSNFSLKSVFFKIIYVAMV